MLSTKKPPAQITSLASPIRITLRPSQTPSQSSSSSTLVNELDTDNHGQADEIPDKLEEIFKLHDLLVKDAKTSREFPFTNIVSVGGQSAGKSSVLSMISGVPLYSATKVATICPLQIHSRKNAVYSAMIEVELEQMDGTILRRPFNTASIPVAELSLATRMAGYQARSCQGIAEEIGSYESLMSMSEVQREKWLEKEKNIKQWTNAKVILHIAGPRQANVSIIDLPGLNGQITKDLIESYINKQTGSHNLILVCCIASTEDGDKPILELVRKHDPKGSRTICLLTKADLVEDVTSIDQLVLGTDPKNEWKPAHGWWPISAKTVFENKKNASEMEIRNREIELFRDDPAEAGWVGLQRQAGRQFGTVHVRAKVYEVFEKMVLKRMQRDLVKQIKDQVVSAEKALGELPPEEIDPIGSLHKIIHEIWHRLTRAILSESVYTRKLHNAQKELDLILAKSLPVFYPFVSGDMDKNETYDTPVIRGWDGSGSTAHIYLDEAIEIVREYTSARDRSFDFGRARTDLIKRFAGSWDVTCKTHISLVWKIVLEAITTVVQSACQSREDLEVRVIETLREKMDSLKSDNIGIVARLCRRELHDPMLIDILSINTKRDYDICVEHFRGYTSQHKLNGLLLQTPPRTPSGQVSARPTELGVASKDTVSEEETQRCFALMGSVTSWLVQGMMRVASVVGRETQGQVVDFLDEVLPTLRKELDLESVASEVSTRSGKLLEPDQVVVEKRQSLGKRKRELELMREKFVGIFAK